MFSFIAVIILDRCQFSLSFTNNSAAEGYCRSEETVQSMLDEELTKDMSKAGGIGLADILYKQVSSENQQVAAAKKAGT